MTEVTQADRDAAAEAFFCKPLLNEKYNDDRRVRAFARHRQQTTEALQADNAKLQADNAKLREALMHYDAALKSSWPYGAKGDAWEHWNEARITLQEAGQTFTRSSDT
ncbi:hypothetical protein UFOVP344_53 [uncultured Caudovirales phage]|uniref:Uncharacterized protein n=1 Tax=uncultured Caudovirales phage TaxID=2100421 RepID=A0A6J5LXF2_9CAUD|nr:hypothetical protein UFOVP344_53 [uncultured Caudovirales phage]